MANFLTTKYPFDFVDKKVEKSGIDSLTDLEKGYYYLGKEMEAK